MITNFEVRSGSLMFVCRALITFLGFSKLSSEFHMKFIEVHHKFACALRSEVAFGINCDVRVVTFVGKEWGNSSGSHRGIVVGEFTKWK